MKILSVEIARDPLEVNNFLYAAPSRSPNLESFTLKTGVRSKDIENSLQKAISTWTALKCLTLPRYYLRPSVLEAVASLHNLVSLELDYLNMLRYDHAAVIQDLSPNAFPKLKTFSFSSDPASASKLLQRNMPFFARLLEIHLNACYGAGDRDIQTFVLHLGKGCPKLKAVRLDLWLRPGFPKEDVSPLPSGVLEGLFPCRRLKVLEVGHPLPITVNDVNVEQMATAWPDLIAFVGAYEPDASLSVPINMGNSLSILSVFAKHFPMMEVLGLFFAGDKVIGFSGDLYPENEFQSLERLCVGVSAVPGGKLHDAAFLIASLCTQMPTVEIGPSQWYAGKDDQKWQDYQRQWEETNQFLEFAMRTKISGRAKMASTGG